MKKKIFAQIALLLILLSQLACDFSNRDRLVQAQTSVQIPLANAEECSVDEFPSSVMLAMREPPEQEDSFFGGFCSGVIIAPDVVLTAAHCIEAIESWSTDETPLTLHITQTDHVSGPEDIVGTAIDTKIHPDYDPISGHDDIGLIFLDSALSIDNVVLPAWGSESTLMSPGIQTHLASFGYTSYEETGGLDTKRCGSSIITAIHDDFFVEGLSGPEGVYAASCAGDSGGAVYYVHGEGKSRQERLIGMHFYGLTNECGGGDYGLQVSGFEDWIDGSMTEKCSDGTRVWCEVEGVLTREYLGLSEIPSAEYSNNIQVNDATLLAQIQNYCLVSDETCDDEHGYDFCVANYSSDAFWATQYGCNNLLVGIGNYYDCLAASSCEELRYGSEACWSIWTAEVETEIINCYGDQADDVIVIGGYPYSYPDGAPEEVEGWTCEPEYYGDGECDCACGVHDSDCPEGYTIDDCAYGYCADDYSTRGIDPENLFQCLEEETVEETCDDGIHNQNEEDIDCGGLCEACVTLPEPTCDDGLRNQGEADIDCGGPCPTACEIEDDTPEEDDGDAENNNEEDDSDSAENEEEDDGDTQNDEENGCHQTTLSPFFGLFVMLAYSLRRKK